MPHDRRDDRSQDYRALVPLLVGGDDIVLEIGCCNGATTALLSRHCKLAIGVPLPRVHRRERLGVPSTLPPTRDGRWD